MTIVLILAAITFVLIFAVLFFLLAARSPEGARLASLTSPDRAMQVEQEHSASEWLMQSDWIGNAAKKVRETIGSGDQSELARRLAMAGLRKPAYADLFFLVKMTLPVAAAALGFLLIQENRFFWTVVLGALGYVAPDFWLTHVISKRRDAIRLSIPDALDLLVICLEAGLGLDQALVRVGNELRISHPELSDEFLLISLEQRAGKPRVDAWRNMADRTNVESVRQFVQMLVQTERFGTPISKSLGSFSDALRVRRRQQAEEMAAKTTIKLIPPLVLFIFPSLFIVLLGPAVILISRNLSKAFSGG